MTLKPKRPCRRAGCPNTTHDGFCPEHQAERYRQQDRQRGEHHAIYSTKRWKRLRQMKLRADPLCELDEGCRRLAVEVHHREDVADRPDLAYEWGNLCSACKSCHSAETARQHLAARRPGSRTTRWGRGG